jgi:hypothetical protein
MEACKRYSDTSSGSQVRATSRIDYTKSLTFFSLLL